MSTVETLEFEASLMASKLITSDEKFKDPVAESRALSAKKAAMERYNKIRGELDELRKRSQA